MSFVHYMLVSDIVNVQKEAGGTVLVRTTKVRVGYGVEESAPYPNPRYLFLI